MMRRKNYEFWIHFAVTVLYKRSGIYHLILQTWSFFVRADSIQTYLVCFRIQKTMMKASATMLAVIVLFGGLFTCADAWWKRGFNVGAFHRRQHVVDESVDHLCGWVFVSTFFKSLFQLRTALKNSTHVIPYVIFIHAAAWLLTWIRLEVCNRVVLSQSIKWYYEWNLL